MQINRKIALRSKYGGTSSESANSHAARGVRPPSQRPEVALLLPASNILWNELPCSLDGIPEPCFLTSHQFSKWTTFDDIGKTSIRFLQLYRTSHNWVILRGMIEPSLMRSKEIAV